ERRTWLSGRDVRAEQLGGDVVGPFACLGREHATARTLCPCAPDSQCRYDDGREPDERATPADVDRIRLPYGIDRFRFRCHFYVLPGQIDDRIPPQTYRIMAISIPRSHGRSVI